MTTDPDNGLRIPGVAGLRIGTAMLRYAECGWYVAPVTLKPGDAMGKNPGGLLGAGWPGKTSRDPETIRGWFSTYKGKIKGIALHVGRSGAVAFDVDTPGKLSGVLATELNGAYTGPFQSTRDNDPSRGHYLFALPPGFMAGNSNGGLGTGWGDVRGLNGVIIVEPSQHEKEHGCYRWQTTGCLPLLPESLRPLLRPPGPGGEAVTASVVEEFTAEYGRGRDTVLRDTVVGRFTRLTADGAYRHTAAFTVACMIARDAMRDRYPAEDAFDRLAELFDAATVDRTVTGEWESILAYAVGSVLEQDAHQQPQGPDPVVKPVSDTGVAFLMGDGAPPATPVSDTGVAFLMGDGAPPAPPAATVEVTPTFLPDGFWNTRPELAHIRDAAHATFADPDAVLYGVLTRIASLLPGDLRVDTGMLDPASLNLFAALVAPSGIGKSGSSKVAARILPVPAFLAPMGDGQPRYFERAPVGTGEGMVESFMGMVEHTDDEGRITRARGQVRHNASFYVDEGKTLTTLMVKREGSTLGPVFRTAWTGDTVGQQNGSAERTRNVSSYALGVLIGFQPVTALPMLDGGDEGTPQRLLWCRLGGRGIPRVPPEHPGPLWGPDVLGDLLGTDPFNSGVNLLGPDRAETTVTMCEALRTQLWEERHSLREGTTELGPYDAHRPLTMVKLSGLLCILARRTQVTEEDWRLAATMWATSCAVRDELLESRQVEANRKRITDREAKVADAVAVKSAVNDEEINRDRVARVVLRKVSKGPCSRRDILNSIASRDRKDGAGSRAVDYAVSKGWITEDNGVFTAPGKQVDGHADT